MTWRDFVQNLIWLIQMCLSGDFDRQCVGVLVTAKKLQLFRKVSTCYYKISDLAEDSDQWKLIEIIPSEDYCYVENNETVLLKLKT